MNRQYSQRFGNNGNSQRGNNRGRGRGGNNQRGAQSYTSGTRVMEIKVDAGTTATREEVIKTTSKQTPITEEAAIKIKTEAEADINRMSDDELNVSDAKNFGITPPKIAQCQIPI